jgi:Tfp pilus assembly protein PilX
MLVKTRREQGFALILAIMSLMLLTFLGLTLATTTSTELQIATNYRYSLQALYNAEAGIEAGKVILQNVANNWGSVLPGVRTATWTFSTPSSTPAPSTAPSSTAHRNWENSMCDATTRDAWTGQGYGAVLDNTSAAQVTSGKVPLQTFEDVTTFQGVSLNGAFSVWVRRNVLVDSSGNYTDDPDNTVLVMTSEGSAPRLAYETGSAVRVLQVRLSRGNQGSTSCFAAEGQTGTASSGANFGACAPLNAAAVASLKGAGATGADTGVK